MKRSLAKSLTLVLSIALLLCLLLGCAQNAASAGSTAASNKSTASSAAATSEKTGKLRIALVLPGSMNDGGWNAAAYNGLMSLKDEGYDCAFTESVAIADIEQALRNYASEGYDLVVGHGFEFGEPVLRVAPEFPKTDFFVSGKMPDGVDKAGIPSNVGFMDMKEYEAAYLAGIVAGGMTESNMIGCIAGLEIPSQLSDMAGFVQGVQYSNPDAKCYGVVTGTYEDPAKGKESALALIDMGCDIIYQSADSTGVGAIEACLDKKVKIIGYGGDQYEMAPDLVMTCFVTDNKNVIIKQAELIETGKFGGLWEPGVAEGVCYITPYHNFEDKIPQKVKDMVDDATAKIKSGELVVTYTLDRLDEKIG